MKNMSSSKFYFGCLVAGMIMATVLSACSLDADSSSFEAEGTTIVSDAASYEVVGRTLTVKKADGADLWFATSVAPNGDDIDLVSILDNVGEAKSNDDTVTLSKADRYLCFKVKYDGKTSYKAYEIEANKKSFNGFSFPKSFDEGEEICDFCCRVDGDTLYYKASSYATVKVVFSASKAVSAAPGNSAVALTGATGNVTIPTSNNKFLLVSVWGAGSDPATDAADYVGWHEIGAVSSSVLPTCWYNGSTYSHGSNVTIPVGGKITFVVSADKASALYADWSSVSSEPTDKSISAYKVEQAVGGELKLEITSNNQATGYIRCWTKGLDGNYGQTFVLTVTPSTTTTQTSTTTPTDTTTTPVVVNTGNFYIDSSFVGVDVQITYEDRAGKPVQRGTVELYTVSVNEKYGKVPLTVNKGEKISVSLIISGQWCDASGNAGWSQSTSWNGNSVTLASYANGGGMTPTGRSVVWTLQ